MRLRPSKSLKLSAVRHRGRCIDYGSRLPINSDRQAPMAQNLGCLIVLRSCSFVAAPGLEEFTDEAILEPSVRALARKVRYELDSTIDYPRHFSGHVKICLADGSVLEANQAHPRGGFEDPLPPEEIEAKFRANASLRLPRERADQIIEAVARLEEMPNVTSLADLLKP
jgi:2-methylcitrate dehydratase MmgE/PrpD-like protein